jgi:RNA polymerase sigma-70 factor (ECF subfamily)
VSASDAFDAAQEVFVSLTRAMASSANTPLSLASWLRIASRRKARDWRELAARREGQSLNEEIDVADEGPSPEARMVGRDVTKRVSAALAQLPWSLRTVLVMSDAEDVPMSQIAKVLDIPVGTGFSRLRAARAAFAHVWNSESADGRGQREEGRRAAMWT